MRTHCAAVLEGGVFRDRFDSRRLALIGLLLLPLACGSEAQRSDAKRINLPAVDDALPERLSDFNLYPDAPRLDVAGVGALSYEPEWPLWSNGGVKQRFVAVPEVADDDSNLALPDPDQLPLGTVFFKTFSFDLGLTSATEVNPVETRVIRLGREGWEFARYQWNDQRTDATLLTDRRSVDVPVRVDGESFNHKIPGLLDCKTCHEAAPSSVLGYTKLQVLDRTIEAAPNPETEAVLGYVVGNCINCHNGSDRENAAYDLRPSVFLQNTINHPTESSASGAGIRIVPGMPDESALLTALAGGGGDGGFKPMPPLGVQRVDAKGVELFRAWIEDLPSWYEAQ